MAKKEKEPKERIKKEKIKKVRIPKERTVNRIPRWYHLDNTALIFPVVAGENMTSVYRISITLKEEIQPELLQEALSIVVPKFSGFNVRMRMGIFWYYFEENYRPLPQVRKEDRFPCRFIRSNKNNGYLFRVTYYKCRINLEVFHVVTDGMGAYNFLRELTYQYLRLAHEELRELTWDGLSQETSLNIEDSFVKNYKQSQPIGFKQEQAYMVKLNRLAAGEFGMMHGYMQTENLKEVARKYNVSINEYVVGVYAWSIYSECLNRMPSKKPIRVAVPVNLRPYFNSNTTKNFFVVVSAEFRPTEEQYTFEQVLRITTDSLREQITKEHLEELFSYSVSNQKNRFLRLVPLPIKTLVMRSVYNRSALANTTTVTNVGKMEVATAYEPYIEMVHACIAMSKGQFIKATVNSYKDRLVITFTSLYADTAIQREFFRKLAQDGVEIRLETNGVYDE